jgi:hypothetical protein
MEPEIINEVVNFARIVLDDERLKIIGGLANGPADVPTLAEQLNLKPALVMRHLAKLSEVGLVRAETGPQASRYHLEVDALHRLKKKFFGLQPGQAGRSEPQNEVEKTLAAYLKGEWLSHIPVKPAKRLIVLEWLAQKFEVDQRYPEKQVNEILNRHFDDHASLRRALVDYGFMERDQGIYWRVTPPPGDDISSSRPATESHQP